MANPPNRDPVVLKLTFPVKFGDQMLEELTFQRPTARELWSLKLPARKDPDAKIDVGELLALGARCAGIPDAVMQRVDTVDVWRILDIVGEHLGSSLPTGTTD